MRYQLIQPQIVELMMIPKTSAIRLGIAADGKISYLGSSEEEAKEIFDAYYKAVNTKKRSFDYMAYEKERKKCEKEQESTLITDTSPE